MPLLELEEDVLVTFCEVIDEVGERDPLVLPYLQVMFPERAVLYQLIPFLLAGLRLPADVFQLLCQGLELVAPFFEFGRLFFHLVTPLGVDPAWMETCGATVTTRPYIVFVGNIKPRATDSSRARSSRATSTDASSPAGSTCSTLPSAPLSAAESLHANGRARAPAARAQMCDGVTADRRRPTPSDGGTEF